MKTKLQGKIKKGKKVTALPWSLNENIWEDILNEEFLCADIMEKYGTDKNFLTPNESDIECKYLYARIKKRGIKVCKSIGKYKKSKPMVGKIKFVREKTKTDLNALKKIYSYYCKM